MKKLLVMLIVVGLSAVAASAGGVGVFGTYLDSEDLGPGYGGGVKFKAEIAEFFAIEVRASCITAFDDWDGDDELYVIPIEGDILINLPLGDSPVTIYGGGGGGYAILPEADDLDLDDSFTFFGLGGLEIALGDSAALFLEGQYRFLEVDGAEGDHGFEIETDLDLGGLSGNAGLLFRF